MRPDPVPRGPAPWADGVPVWMHLKDGRRIDGVVMRSVWWPRLRRWCVEVLGDDGELRDDDGPVTMARDPWVRLEWRGMDWGFIIAGEVGPCWVCKKAAAERLLGAWLHETCWRKSGARIVDEFMLRRVRVLGVPSVPAVGLLVGDPSEPAGDRPLLEREVSARGGETGSVVVAASPAGVVDGGLSGVEVEGESGRASKAEVAPAGEGAGVETVARAAGVVEGAAVSVSADQVVVGADENGGEEDVRQLGGGDVGRNSQVVGSFVMPLVPMMLPHGPGWATPWCQRYPGQPRFRTAVEATSQSLAPQSIPSTRSAE